MTFAESFSSILEEYGIEVNPETLPDRDTVALSLQGIETYLNSADPAVAQGYDEGTEEYAICYVMAEPDVNVAPDIPTLLAAFDQISGQRLSGLVSIAQDCLARAED